MKKLKNTKSLTLNAQTIRVLEADKLAQASGGAEHTDQSVRCPTAACIIAVL